MPEPIIIYETPCPRCGKPIEVKDLVVLTKMSDGVFGTVHHYCPGGLSDSDKDVTELREELRRLMAKRDER